MESPPEMGASHSTGRILCGKVYGNNLNHADFLKIIDIPQAGNQQIAFKVFAYIIYADPVTVDVIPDPSVCHNVSFIVSTVPPLDCAMVLKRIADCLDSITVRAGTPVVSELWGATQQPWGRSLEKQLRSFTMGVTLHIN